MTLLPLLLAAVSAAAPQSLVLNADLPVWDVTATDIDGDGRSDLLALCGDPDRHPLRKQLAVYLGSASGYPTKPSFALTLEPDTGSVFLAEVDGKAPLEVVVSDPAGARIYSYADGKLNGGRRSDFSSLLPSRVQKPVFLPDTATDLNGDGIDEWLLPMSTGFEIRNADTRLAHADADVTNSIDVGELNRVVHRLPTHHPFEMPGQTQKGVVFLSDQFADFAYGDNWSQSRRYEVPRNLKEKWSASSRMEDMDGNGLPDLVVTQTHGTVNLKVLTQVYLAKEPFVFPKTPDATFQVSGALTAPLIKDVDGDEKMDLLFVKVPFGVKLFVSYFVTQKLPMQIEAHLYKDGAFAPSPDLRASLTVDAPEERKRVAYTMGDFNGDKRIDVAFGSGADALVIHTGEEDRLISVKPWQTLTMPSIGEARTYDLDGNPGQDLVVFHPSTDDSKRIDVTLF